MPDETDKTTKRAGGRADSGGAAPAWPPQDRPIVGADLEEFRQRFGLDLNQIESIFGIASRGAWYRITRKQADQPLKDKTLAILLRFYAQHPDLIPVPDLDVREVWQKLGLEAGDFAQLIGRQTISGRDWAKGTKPLPVVLEISKILNKAGSMSHPHTQDIKRLSELENATRGEEPPQIGSQGPARSRRTKRQTEADRGMITLT